MTSSTVDIRPLHQLDDEMLERFRTRAAGYDRDNRFFHEDFDELSAAGYLRAAVPADLGGGGATLAELVRSQRRLAAAAPPTALALTMHLYLTGTAAQVAASPNRSRECLWRVGSH